MKKRACLLLALVFLALAGCSTSAASAFKFRVAAYAAQPKEVPVYAATFDPADITLDDDNSIIKDEASCRVNISLELWKHGEMVKKVDYRSKFSDATVNVMEMTFLGTILQNALQNAMKQAVPDIVRQMEI